MSIDKERVLELLEELSDVELQNRLWLSDGENGADVSSYAETLCQLFDDTGLKDELAMSQVIFGVDIDDDLRELDRITDHVDLKLTTAERIKSQPMQLVRKLAASIRSKLLRN
jgi:hypothetical protein